MRRIAAILIVIFTAGALFAADDPPRFFIERIDVRNTRHASPAIIRAETRLVEGRTYSEADLREASYRVARLPFVLDAQYSLEKGSRRDAYVFVITVSETKPFFYDIDLRPYIGRLYGDQSGALVVGGRIFAGTKGVFHVAVGSSDFEPHNAGLPGIDNYGDPRAWQVGYTRYDLFGSRAFATISVGRRFGFPTGGASPHAEMVLGVPMTGNQTLSVTAGRSSSLDYEYSSSGRFRQSTRADVETVSWSYNTTDSPFLPTRGQLVSLGARRISNRTSGLYFDPDAHSRTDALLLTASYERHWELSEKNSIAILGDGEAGRVHYDDPTFMNPFDRGARSYDYESVSVDFSHSLFDGRKARAVGESWLDFGVGLRHRSEISRCCYLLDTSRTGPSVSASWSRRTPWGRLRFGAVYSW